MHDMNAFERQLTGAMEQRAGPLQPVDDEGIFEAIGTAAKPSRWSFQSMFSATNIVVAGAIVALFGGFLLAGVLTQSGEQQAPAIGPTASLSPVELPSVIPDGIESGTLDTPLGTARWVRLGGDAVDVPDLWDTQPVPGGGYVALNADEQDRGLWRSSNLIVWEPVPAPGDSMWGQLSSTGDRLWLRYFEPASLWSSRDGSDWIEVSLEPLAPPQPDGPWILEIHGPLTFDGIIGVPIKYSPYRLLIHEEMGGARRDRVRAFCCEETGEAGAYRLFDDRGGTVWAARFEEAGNGLRVLDAEDGAELAFLDGVGLDFIELLADEGEPDAYGFALLDEDGLTQVALPTSITSRAETAFGVDGSGFVAFSYDRDGLVRIHRSEDGRTWTETDLVGDDPDEPTDIEFVENHQGMLQIGHHDNTSSILEEDGTWKTLPEEPPFGFRLADGALWVNLDDIQAGDSTSDAIWYQRGEAEPISIDPDDSLGLIEHALRDMEGRGTGHANFSPLGPNAAVLSFGDEIERDLWVIAFDDVDGQQLPGG